MRDKNWLPKKLDSIEHHWLVKRAWWVIFMLIPLILGGVEKCKSIYWPTLGSCQLAPQSSAHIGLLNELIADGRTAAAQGKLQEASKKFGEVISRDPHYLGAHQNLGIIQLEQNHFEKAVQSFRTEKAVVECMKGIPYEQLWRFAGVLSSQNLRKDQKNAVLLNRIDQAEDTVNFNLACALARQGETQNALDQLKKASGNQSIDRSIVQNEEDFTSLHDNPNYQSVLDLFPNLKPE